MSWYIHKNLMFSCRGYGCDSLPSHQQAFTINSIKPLKEEKHTEEEMNISLRAGQLSSQPLMNFSGIQGDIHVSFAFYNTTQEIDILMAAPEQYINIDESNSL